jgi:hypothetical protein
MTMMNEAVKTYHFSNYFAESVFKGDFKNWKENAVGTLLSMPMALGATGGYHSLITGLVGVYEEEDELKIRASLKHELTHFLSGHGVIHIPAEWEQITSAVHIIEYVRKGAATLEEGEAKLADHGEEFDPAVVELYQRGKEMGLSGRTGFIVHPGVSDRKAGYFSIDYLLNEARSVYEAKGVRADVLRDSYRAQRAAGILIAGILMGMSLKDETLKPLRLLKDFFDVLYERYGDRTEDNPELKQRLENIQKEIKEYASASFGQRITLVPALSGLWSYVPVDDFAGELRYVKTDLYPRFYDGANKGDLKAQMTAARERGLGQAFLSVSRAKFGLRDLIPRLPKEAREHTAVVPLWDTLLLPRVGRISLDHNLKDIKAGAMNSQYQGAGRWIMRVFKDRYAIGNNMVEETLFLSQPLHLQFLDTLLYRRFNFDPRKTTGNVHDPRVRNQTIEEAVAQTMGSVDDPQDFGWAKLLFTLDHIPEDRLVEIVGRKIWPVYQSLYEQAFQEEERWRAYQRKMKEEKKEALREAFEQLAQEALEELERYRQNLPAGAKEAIQDAVQEMMDQAMENFGNPSMPAQGAQPSGMRPRQGPPPSGKGGQRMPGMRGTPAQGSPSPDIDDIEQTLNTLGEQLDDLSSRINDISEGLGEVKAQAGGMGAGSLPKKDIETQRQAAEDIKKEAGQIQELSNDLLSEGREAAAQGSQQNDMVSRMRQGLPSPEEANKTKALSEEVDQRTQKLLDQLQTLQDRANQLAQGANNLGEKLNEPEPDGGQVMGQIRHIQNTVENLKEQADQAGGTNRDIQRQIHRLEEGIKGLQESLTPSSQKASSQKDAQPQKEGDSKQPASEDASAKDRRGQILPRAPEGPLHLEMKDAKPMEEIFHQDTTPPGSRIQPVKVKPFDSAKAAEREEEILKERTGLNKKEREELESWYNSKVRYKSGQVVTVREMAQRLTSALEVLTLPAVDIERTDHLEDGPILSDMVAAVLGDPARSKIDPSEPLPVKMTFLIDVSASMEGAPIEMTRLIYFILANALLNHNEKREAKGYQPIEFEVVFFADDEGRVLISHETIRDRNFRRERVLYEGWKNTQALEAGTHYASNLYKYTGRLLQSEDRGEEKSVRVLFALTD